MFLLLSAVGPLIHRKPQQRHYLYSLLVNHLNDFKERTKDGQHSKHLSCSMFISWETIERLHRNCTVQYIIFLTDAGSKCNIHLNLRESKCFPCKALCPYQQSIQVKGGLLLGLSQWYVHTHSYRTHIVLYTAQRWLAMGGMMVQLLQ